MCAGRQNRQLEQNVHGVEFVKGTWPIELRSDNIVAMPSDRAPRSCFFFEYKISRSSREAWETSISQMNSNGDIWTQMDTKKENWQE